jgi:hypothetical protein
VQWRLAGIGIDRRELRKQQEQRNGNLLHADFSRGNVML